MLRPYRIRQLLAAAALAGAAALPIQAHETVVRVQDLPSCAQQPFFVWVVNGTDADDCARATGGQGSDRHACWCLNSAYVAIPGTSSGGSGDITDVWTDSSGDVSALVAASGDSFDAGSADASSPATRSTSLPGTCSEGQLHQDTNSGGSEVYVCTATDTWVKLLPTSTLVTDDVAPYGQYDVDNPPSTCHACDEFTDDTPTQTWTCAGNNGTDSYLFDSLRMTHAQNSAAGANHYICTFDPSATTTWTMTAKFNTFLQRNNNHCGLGLIRTGTQSSPTLGTYCGFFANTPAGNQVNAFLNTFTSLTSSTGVTSFIWGDTVPYTHYVQWRYDDSADTLTCHISNDGMAWKPIGTGLTSVTADPLYVGIFIDDQSATVDADVDCYVEWIRLRTDSDGIATPPYVGE